MKMKNGLIGVTVLFMGLTTVFADDTSAPALPPAPASTPAPAPAPATPPPVVTPAVTDTNTTTSTNKVAEKKARKKAVAKKKEKEKEKIEAAASPLATNSPAVSKQNNVNVRAQSHINSEVITRLKQGESVTVIGEVTLKHPKTDEPARWAKIALPAGTHVWINSPFIDTNNAVKPAKLNMRSGAGENYSVIGTLVKGD